MRKKIILIFLLALQYLLHAKSAMGQPPVNDEATGAIMLTLGAGCGTTYSNVTATQSPNEPLASCSDDPVNPIYTGQHLVWFKFIAPTSGAVRVSNNNTDYTFDSQIALFSAGDSSNYNTFQIITCDDDCNCGAHNYASLFYAAGLTCGQTYYLLVDGWTPDDYGTFCITVDEVDNTMLGNINTCATNYPNAWGGGNAWPINPHYKGWMSLLDNQCNIVVNVRDTAGCYANSFTCKQNVNQGSVRQLPNGTHYLDRNYLVNSTALTANVQLQFFYLNTEFNALDMASGNNLTLYNMHVFKQDGACSDDYVAAQQSTELSQTGCANQYLGTTGSVDWVTSNVPGFPSGGASNFYLVPDTVAPPPAPQHDSICIGDTIIIHGDQVCGLTWQALPGGSPLSSLNCITCATPAASPQQTTTYVEISSSISYCNDTITVVVTHPFSGGVSIDTTICLHDSAQLSIPLDTSLGTVENITWTPDFFLSNNTISDPKCSPFSSISYYVNVNYLNNKCKSKETDTVNVAVSTLVKPGVTDTFFCQNVAAPVLHIAADSLTWYTSASSISGAPVQPLIITSQAGFDTFYVANRCGEAPVYIQVIDVPVVILGDTAVCEGGVILLNAPVANDVRYQWNTGDTTCCITVDTSGVYTVKASNVCGEVTDSIHASFDPCNECLWAPTAFTPNGDGKNDRFYVNNQCSGGTFRIIILNRFGQVVYNSVNISEGWDGTFNGQLVDIGTYYYWITILPEVMGGRQVSLKGDVTVIR